MALPLHEESPQVLPGSAVDHLMFRTESTVVLNTILGRIKVFFIPFN